MVRIELTVKPTVMSVLAQLYLYSREHSSTPSERLNMYYTKSLFLSTKGILLVAV